MSFLRYFPPGKHLLSRISTPAIFSDLNAVEALSTLNSRKCLRGGYARSRRIRHHVTWRSGRDWSFFLLQSSPRHLSLQIP